MQFPTLVFALFFIVTCTLYWLLRPWRGWQKLFLLAASYVFYGWADWHLLSLLFGATLIYYLAAAGVTRSGTPASRRAWVAAGTVAGLGLLVVFKYYGFFADSLDGLVSLLGLNAHLPVLQLLWPVALSFYTFQGLSYLIDVYRQRMPPAGLLDFALFIAFFPKLMCGPLVRAKEFLPQLAAPAPARIVGIDGAAGLILSGLFKKAVLASYLDGQFVTGVFDAPENYTAPAVILAALAYSVLIYADFSGYTDLARALAILLGFDIPENFRHPYLAADIGDFWRRWHITLSMWLRDYLFLPLAEVWARGLRRWLSLRRSALWGSQASLLVTFGLCGLWHGAGWSFVLWGLFHGVMLFTHHGLRDGLRWRWRGGWAGVLGTFLLVTLGWVLFRAVDLATAGHFYGRMLSFSAHGQGFALPALVAVVLGLALQVWGERLRGGYLKLSGKLFWPVRVAFWVATGLAILALKPSIIAPYIYFGF